MNERMQILSFTIIDPSDAAAVSTLEYYWDALFDFTIVGVSVAPEKDDAGASVDIDDDGTNIISAVDATDANVPGTWKSTHITGGTETPVHVAAGSKMSFDCNSVAVATAIHVVLYILVGAVST